MTFRTSQEIKCQGSLQRTPPAAAHVTQLSIVEIWKMQKHSGSNNECRADEGEGGETSCFEVEQHGDLWL